MSLLRITNNKQMLLTLAHVKVIATIINVGVLTFPFVTRSMNIGAIKTRNRQPLAEAMHNLV